jgi:hypothetical protein
LLNYKSQHLESYCSNTHQFSLLFRDVPRTLAEELLDRRAAGRCFSVEEVEAVVGRGAKAIKYLYDIFHHHEAISAQAFTWPINQNNTKEAVQLIDEWMLPTDYRENKYKNLRPKDQSDAEEKNTQKCIDLGNLGHLAQEMMSIGKGANWAKGRPGYTNLMNKIHILTNDKLEDRNQIYSMLSSYGNGADLRVDMRSRS